MIAGSGQTVYWRGCNVTVIGTGSDGKEQFTPLKDKPDGQGVVPQGIKLYITDGKIKEG